ncbi:Trehalose utilization [Rhizoctonia solani]|uniref:Trehalose utilization n=1 Tax=Rhizoctonia solani TaxID=456999 RepID=A0A8H7I7R1_9AGAM|nr:Trehalose utilization [Rhizoctonia solani]
MVVPVLTTILTTIPRLLIYTATEGYRHESIETATAALFQLGQQHNLKFDHTEDRTLFNDKNLAKYDAVVFLNNNDEVLNEDGKKAFQKYLNKGATLLAFTVAEPAYTTQHFTREKLTFVVLDENHPSTKHLPDRWTYTEEVYHFRQNPRDVGAKILLSVDRDSYLDNINRTQAQGSPHPIAWYQERGAGAQDPRKAGRSFYTSLGHLNSTWKNDIFLKHVLGGIQWSLDSNTTLWRNPKEW